MDLDDLKAGHLERIEERQQKDPEAKKCSVIVIIKEKEVHHHHYDKWYFPYQVTWNQEWLYHNTVPYIYSDSSSIDNACFTLGSTEGSSYIDTDYNGITINCSVAKDASIGTYNLGQKIINFR